MNMLNKVKILRFLGMALLLIAVAFTLSGCSKEGAMPEDQDEKSLAEEHRQCWQKEVLSLLYDTMGKVAMGMYSKITQGALSFMMVAFAVWFAFRLLKFVSSFKDASGEHLEMWNEVLQKLLLCFICGYLASSTEGLLWILNMVIFPVYNAFLEFGSKILEASSIPDAQGNNTITVFGETITGGKNIICRSDGIATASLTGFPESPRNLMECMICSVNERLTLGNYLAFRVMKMEGFMATIVGLLILVCFTIIKLGFVFYLVDTIFKFTIMVVILPLLIMAYAFQQTRNWTNKGVVSIFTSAAFMMVIALLIAMALLAVTQILQDNPETFNPQGEEQEAAFKELNPAVMGLLLLAFLIKNTLSVAQKMVSAIIGESVKANFQKKLEALVMGLGKAVLAWLTAGGSKVIDGLQRMKKVQEAMEKAKKTKIGKAAMAVNKKYQDAKDAHKRISDKLNSLQGKD